MNTAPKTAKRKLSSKKTGRRPVPFDKKELEQEEDLFDLLLEQSIPSTPEGWFSVPWNYGLNAIELALTLNRFSDNCLLQQVETFCQKALHSQNEESKDMYWEARDLMDEISKTEKDAAALITALRMLQQFLASSDGGGNTYNWNLRKLCEGFLVNGAELEAMEKKIRWHRSMDAILGVRGSWLQSSPFASRSSSWPTPSSSFDLNTNRRLAAFETAWKKGLYKIAYCV